MWSTTRPYPDRAQAGRELAVLLQALRGHGRAVVLALPRGGVPVASPVATALDAPLDVLVVRKLGLPRAREVAMGAVAVLGGELEVVDVPRDGAGAEPGEVEEVRQEEVAELRRREAVYRGGNPAPELLDRVVVLVDDGLATGATMRAALAAVRRRRPARVVVAVPVGSREACGEVADLVDELVCPWRPVPFRSVSAAYADFRAPDDAEVLALLGRAAEAPEPGPLRDGEASTSEPPGERTTGIEPA